MSSNVFISSASRSDARALDDQRERLALRLAGEEADEERGLKIVTLLEARGLNRRACPGLLVQVMARIILAPWDSDEDIAAYVAASRKAM